MELKLKSSEFQHDAIKSVYNHNLYNHKEFGYTILEKCIEEYDYFEYYLVQNNTEIFIGCSQKGFGDTFIITIDFMKYYT